MRREWREDDPLNGPRCLTSATVGAVITILLIVLVARMAHCADWPDSPGMSQRKAVCVGDAMNCGLPEFNVAPIELYPPDERLRVHNSPSTLHHNWAARHPRILGAIAIGAAAGLGAGIAISQRRGICQGTYEGQSYYGTAPCPAGTVGTHGRIR